MTNKKPILISLPSSYAASPLSVVSTSSGSSSGEMDGEVRRGKKRRLDHLTWEEKVQRKKMKNRVAAQTSRDRKKMKMDEMESSIAQLADENDELKAEFRTLECENKRLRHQNDTLQQQLDELRQRLDEQEERLAEQDKQLRVQKQQLDEDRRERTEEEAATTTTTSLTAATVTDIALKTGSAASTDVDPLQQGLSATKAKSMTTTKTTTTSSVWQVIALCLLYKICSKSQTGAESPAEAMANAVPTPCSTCAPGKTWPKLYSQISPDKWQAILREAATKLPRMQAPYRHCLDNWWGPEQSAWNPAKVEA